jgi:hypothetical protein
MAAMLESGDASSRGFFKKMVISPGVRRILLENEHDGSTKLPLIHPGWALLTVE